MRSANLGLDGLIKGGPGAVVGHLLAVQAQEYLPAQWSLGQRGEGVTSSAVDAALAAGEIVRTHALRPTWHFLAPDDARAILELTGPRVRRSIAHRHRDLDLDARTLTKAERVVVKAVSGGGQLTRAELGEVLTKSGIEVTGQRLPHILLSCELALAVSSGAWRGKDPTYAAFDERVPLGRTIDPADAIRMVVERYLRSHGPAAIADLGWWAGLKVAEIKTALDELGPQVVSATVDGIELWWFEPTSVTHQRAEVRLLETYDEFIVGYTRSRFLGDPNQRRAIDAWRSRTSMPNLVTRGGVILGGWRRTRKGPRVAIQVEFYEEPSRAVTASLRREAERFAAFYDLEPMLEVVLSGR